MIVAGVTVVVFGTVRQVTFDHEDRVLSLLDESNRSESDIGLEVSKAQGGLSKNFDKLARTQGRIRAIVEGLKTEPGAIYGRGERTIDRVLTEFKIHFRMQETKLEDFKSSLAIVSNSASYLPSALEEVRAEFADRPIDRTILPRIEKILYGVLASRLNRNSAKLEHLY